MEPEIKNFHETLGSHSEKIADCLEKILDRGDIDSSTGLPLTKEAISKTTLLLILAWGHFLEYSKDVFLCWKAYHLHSALAHYTLAEDKEKVQEITCRLDSLGIGVHQDLLSKNIENCGEYSPERAKFMLDLLSEMYKE